MDCKKYLSFVLLRDIEIRDGFVSHLMMPNPILINQTFSVGIRSQRLAGRPLTNGIGTLVRQTGTGAGYSEAKQLLTGQRERAAVARNKTRGVRGEARYCPINNEPEESRYTKKPSLVEY